MKGAISITLPAAALLLAVAAPPVRADTRVVLSRLVDGPEFVEAMEFFSSYLTPEQYDTERKLAGREDIWKLGKTLDLYLRQFVLAGRGDVNDDGNDEFFYILDDPGWCGSKGCLLLVIEKRAGAKKVMCETRGADHHVWITNRMTVNGYREMEATFSIYWRGDECVPDDPEIRELLPPRDPLRQ